MSYVFAFLITSQRLSRGRSPRSHRGQHGVALVVALILLLVITLVGLAAVRGTIMQQKMSGNMYDREIAFQSAEAAMRVAMARIGTNPADIARNCQSTTVICLANPFNDSGLPAGSIHDVVSGTASGQYTTGSSLSQPQYVIENMGNWVNPNANMGFGQSAGSHNYMPSSGGSPTSIYYRITARSGDPANVDNRAVVTLQAMVKQG